MTNFEEKTLSSTDLFNGIVIKIKRDEILAANGKQGLREVAVHNGGVVIAAFDENENVILIKQWRYPIHQELIEVPAGKLELGEDPFEAAKRELQEESGYIAENWENLGYIYTTPGFCTEKLYLYKATGLKYVGENFDETEMIESFKVSKEEALNMIKENKIQDAKTICILTKAIK